MNNASAAVSDELLQCGYPAGPAQPAADPRIPMQDSLEIINVHTHTTIQHSDRTSKKNQSNN
jgi:hypothetical protein